MDSNLRNHDLKKTKICIFANYFPIIKGGAEYQAYLIANSLDPQRFEVFFLSFNNENRAIIKRDGYKIYSIKTHKILSKFGKPYFLYYFQIKQILSKEKPDIIYRRMGSSIPGILCFLKKKLHFKLIWACAHVNDLSKVERLGIKNVFSNFDILLRIYGIRNADKILVQTNDQKQLLWKNFRRHATLFPNVHPTHNIHPTEKSLPIKILWIANFKSWKQPEYFLNLVECFQDHPEVRFIMVGRSGAGISWHRLNDKMNSLKQFEYKGELPIKHVNQLLEESHIFINTSLYEGFPNTFIQAWMRKVPVISLNVDPDHMIENNKIGFHSRTFDRLVKDTRTLITNHEVRHEMGERAQKYALDKFSSTNLKKLTTLFETI